MKATRPEEHQKMLQRIAEAQEEEVRQQAFRDAIAAIDEMIETAETPQVQIGAMMARTAVMRLAGIDERD